MNPIYIRENIIFLRKKEGLTQEALGKAIDKSANSIANYENGKSDPTIFDVITLAQTLDVRIDYFLYKKIEDMDYKDFIKNDNYRYVGNVIKTQEEKKNDIDKLMIELDNIRQRIREIE